MVCMQTSFTRDFVPDVHRLLGQEEFERVPIVWLNPQGESRVIWRDDQLALKNQVFSELIKEARGRAAAREHRDSDPEARAAEGELSHARWPEQH